MRRTNLYLTSLIACGLTTWTVAAGQESVDRTAAPDQTTVQQDVSVEVDGNVDTPNADIAGQNGQVDTRRPADRDREMGNESARRAQRSAESANDLREWAGQEPARGERQTDPSNRSATTRPSQADQQQASGAPQGDRDVVNTDIYIFEDGRGELPGYWTHPDNRQAFRGSGTSRDGDAGQFYGYSDEPVSGPSARGATGVPSAVVHPVPTEADVHDWSDGRNLVDDNYIQNRDKFEVDRDFYTKEWKVAAPPLTMHPRFHTIYDSSTTQQYYTPWFGSPVLWSPNRMTAVPLPQTRNQLLSSRQKWTYFDELDKDNISNTPTLFGSAGTAITSTGMRGDVYGYQSPEAAGQARFSTKDGAIRIGKQAMYWDDQDLFGSGAGMSGAGFTTYGFVSPESAYIGTPQTLSPSGELHNNIPRSTQVDIYGVPTGTDQSTTGNVETRTTTDIYGYTEVEHDGDVKVKKHDKDCDDDDVHYHDHDDLDHD